MFASAASFLPQPDFAVYAATKSFVLSYSRALNEELKDRDIAVTAVCPGPVRTEFFDIAETTGQIPLYKMLVMANPPACGPQGHKGQHCEAGRVGVRPDHEGVSPPDQGCASPAAFVRDEKILRDRR